MSITKGLGFFFIFTSVAFAGERVHDGTAEEIQRAIQSNEKYHATHVPSVSAAATPFRPVQDTADFAYVLMSSDEEGDSEVTNLRSTIAQNLPQGVKLVILADKENAESVQQEYAPWISADRMILATDENTDEGFWARDSFPIPVFDDAQGDASLVAANYYRDFSSWNAIASAVGASMQKEDFTFVGGNMIADEDGNCFSVDSYRLFTATAADLSSSYGCKTVHIMPHVRGLGDVDEVLKPLPGKRILTNSPEYTADLQSWGYQVIPLPTRSEQYRTYVNSLVVNGTVFMPAYGDSQDADAQKVYESLGYQVFPITSVSLSDDMHGSVHCQTMAYPKMGTEQLLKALGLRVL